MDKIEYLDALTQWTDYTLARLGIALAVIVLLVMACMCCLSVAVILW